MRSPDDIATTYFQIGSSFLDETDECGRGTRGGGVRSAFGGDIERKQKIFLRLGMEFLLYALYLKRGYNIYKCETSAPRHHALHRLADARLMADFDVDFTLGLTYLIDKLPGVLTEERGNMDFLQDTLRTITDVGGDAVHSETFERGNIAEARRVKMVLENGINPPERPGGSRA